MTEEQKRKRWPIEWRLRDVSEKYKITGELTREIQEEYYNSLLSLAKAVMSHKYGTNSRLDYDSLPHEIATSVYMTIVVKNKEVFSWTNLMKKVVFDLASNYFRKEVYGTAHLVDIDQLGEDDDLLDGSEGSKLAERYEIASGIKVQDLIYFEQVINICFDSLSRLCFRINNLRDHLLLKYALHEISFKEKHHLYSLVDKNFHHRYNMYLVMLQLELGPILNAKYFQQAFIHV